MNLNPSRAFLCAAAFATLLTAPAIAALGENQEHVKKLRETRQCQGCDLQRANLDGLDAGMGDLRDANLADASLYKANLGGADLTGAVFTGANLSGANLQNTKGANLAGAITDERTRCPSGSTGPCK